MKLPDVAAALRHATALGVDRLDAQLLLGHLLGRSRTWLYAHDDHPLPADDAERFAAWLARRAAGEPVAYLVGHKEFHGLDLQVSPSVLVPRPDTETLVDWALDVLQQHEGPAGARAVDLGTGSGAIALALKKSSPATHVCATDLSPAALAIARSNGQRLQLDIEWQQGAWWAPLAGRRFHLVVSNPPYIAGDDTHLDALQHEPRMALTPEGDGLQALRDIVAGAAQHLEPGGHLLLEHGHDQGAAVRDLLAHAGFTGVATRRDLAGVERCTGGRCAGAATQRPPVAFPHT